MTTTGPQAVAKIAMISEHASPLAAAGGVDAGGQNIYVAHTARHLAELGYAVDIFTRRDSDKLPDIVEWHPGIRVIHITAGPPRFVRKESLLPLMSEFAREVVDAARRANGQGEPYALCHAHFFMSGLVARRLKQELGIPFVVTFHALGRVRLMHQPHDEFPPERCVLEQMVIDAADAIIAECPQDQTDLQRLYRTPSSRLRMIPCGFDPDELAPVDRREARARLRLPQHRPIVLQLGRMVPRKGVETVVRALGIVERRYDIRPLLVIVGGESFEPDPALRPALLLLRRGRLRHDAMVRAVRHHAGRSDGVRCAGHRLARRRRPILGRGWAHGVPRRAAQRGSARAASRARIQQSLDTPAARQARP
jgi:D-inositol-3-phosphate glycosyltransferase